MLLIFKEILPLGSSKTSSDRLNPLNIDPSMSIKSIKINSVYIGNGILAFLGSLITLPLAGSSITHWWVEIEASNNTFYNAQFDGDNILRLSLHKNAGEVDRKGIMGCGCRADEKKKFMCKGRGSVKNKTIGDVVKFMEEYNGKYSLIFNNCQLFAKKLSKFLVKEWNNKTC